MTTDLALKYRSAWLNVKFLIFLPENHKINIISKSRLRKYYIIKKKQNFKFQNFNFLEVLSLLKFKIVHDQTLL
jgi:hypothetical protein